MANVGDEKGIPWRPGKTGSTAGGNATPNIQPKPSSPQRAPIPGVKRVQNLDNRYIAGKVGPLEPSREDLLGAGDAYGSN